jgi:hypothetical protein
VFLLQIIIFLGGATVLALLIAWPFIIIGRLGRRIKLLEEIRMKRSATVF